MIDEFAMQPSEKYTVQIVQSENDEVIHSTESRSLRSAIKVRSGMNINLDHERFHTRIVNSKGEEVNEDGELIQS